MFRIAPFIASLAFSASVLVASFATSPPTQAADATPRGQEPRVRHERVRLGQPKTTDRDLGLLKSAGFGWQKTLFQWRDIEPARGAVRLERGRPRDSGVGGRRHQGDRPTRLASRPGRAATAPTTARRTTTTTSADFVSALVARYGPTRRSGTIQAIEVWNEPNLAREWGKQPINQDAGWRLRPPAEDSLPGGEGGRPERRGHHGRPLADRLERRHRPARRVVPAVDVRRRRQRRTSTCSARTAPASRRRPTSSPEEAAANPVYGGHRSFTFRRVEELRDDHGGRTATAPSRSGCWSSAGPPTTSIRRTPGTA